MIRSKLIGILLLLILPVLVFAGVASAQTFRSGDSATVSADEVVNSTLWTGGQTVDIAGEVNGDVFCVGQNVTISGKIDGDVICAAQTITISGSVSGDIRAAGQTVTISGSVSGNLTTAGQTVSIESKSKIGSDASVAGQDARIDGSIGRDLALATQNTTVYGKVGRNITATVDNLALTNTAKVGGNIEYTSQNEANVSSSAKIAGKTVRKEPKTEDSNKSSDGSLFGFNIIASFAMLLAALALVLIFPKAFHKVSDQAVNSPGKTLLTGFIASIMVPIAIFLIMITILGIPLGLVAIVAWILIVALSGPAAAYYTGRLIWKKQTNPIQIMLIGGIILLAVRLVPVLGFIVMVFAVWFGIGMILLELKNRTPKPRYQIKASK